MGDKSAIEWTDATWNPVTGCSKVSAGCKNCYAERVFPRAYSKYRVPIIENGRDPDPANDLQFRPRQFTDVRTHPDRLEQPLHWKKPRKIFVNSMSDLFHEDVSFEFIDKVFAVMALCPQHTFQILTKRPERMREYCSSGTIKNGRNIPMGGGFGGAWVFKTFPLPNVWLGVSCEDQKTADERIPILLQVPAAVRFCSYEPALGSVNFSRWMWPMCWHWAAGFKTPEEAIAAGAYAEQKPQALVSAYAVFLDWVIIGGESGPKARPFNLQWARDVVAQCKAAGVPVFVKQFGTAPYLTERVGLGSDTRLYRLKDRKGGDPSEWEEGLRVREFPNPASVLRPLTALSAQLLDLMPRPHAWKDSGGKWHALPDGDYVAKSDRDRKTAIALAFLSWFEELSEEERGKVREKR